MDVAGVLNDRFGPVVPTALCFALRTVLCTLLLTGSGKIRLVRRSDGEETILDEAPLGALADVPQRLTLTADGETITGSVGDRPALSASDATFDGGAVALLCTEGRIEVSGVHIAPLQETPAT